MGPGWSVLGLITGLPIKSSFAFHSERKSLTAIQVELKERKRNAVWFSNALSIAGMKRPGTTTTNIILGEFFLFHVKH